MPDAKDSGSTLAGLLAWHTATSDCRNACTIWNGNTSLAVSERTVFIAATERTVFYKIRQELLST